MRKLVITTLLSLVTLCGASAANAQVSFGIRIGPPPAPRALRVIPRSPGAGYIWVDGYWYPTNGRYVWHQGYWTRPPYEGAVWVRPRYEGGQFYGGYWEGSRGRFEHSHRWDRERGRDFERYRDRDDRRR